MKSAIIFGTTDYLAADGYRPAIEIAKMADSIGIDVVSVPEHLALTTKTAPYLARYNALPWPSTEAPMVEPMVFLGMLAGVTQRIQLGTCVMLTPLRSGLVMAKQIAMLDYLSGGRTLLGLGAGWHQAEFDATDMPWEGRHRHLLEQVRAMRVLWSEAPASFKGEFINFEGLHSHPQPVQGKDIPLFFGMAATDHNIRKMAELGVGWSPTPLPIDTLATSIAKIRQGYRAAGRSEAELKVMAFARVESGANGPDLDRTLASVAGYAEIGVDILTLVPAVFCDTVKGHAAVLEKIHRAVKG